MPRPLRIPLLFLLLGVILNIILTWAFCITLQRPPSVSRSTLPVTHSDPHVSDWPYVLVHQNRPPDQFIRAATLLNTMDTGVWDQPPPDFHTGDSAIVVVNTGLPLRSMRYHFDLTGNGDAERITLVGGWRVSNSVLSATFPLRPIWPGFALDALLLAALLWCVTLGPRTFRSAIRARAGRCIACGYNRSGLAPTNPCPECGRLPRATQAPAFAAP